MIEQLNNRLFFLDKIKKGLAGVTLKLLQEPESFI